MRIYVHKHNNSHKDIYIKHNNVFIKVICTLADSIQCTAATEVIDSTVFDYSYKCPEKYIDLIDLKLAEYEMQR